MLQLEPGVLFADRFEIIQRIGAGGMGAVYLAKDARNPDFKVAVKILYPGIIKTREARERFRNEILAAYRLHHPNIVRAYEYFDLNDVQAFAMELVDGGDLANVITKGPMPSGKAVNILKQLCHGLEAIHQSGIVHRDLKPENILINSQGVYKISDFGVARIEGNNTLTQAGALVGTPKYLAPEYIEKGTCDHRGDIYALGVIAFEMLAGKSPFEGTNKTDMLLDRFKVKPALKLAKEVPNCPEVLRQIVDRALSVRVADRYQTAQAMLEDIERYERGTKVRAAVSRVVGESHQGPLVGLGSKSREGIKTSLTIKALMVLVSGLIAAGVYASVKFKPAIHQFFPELAQGMYEGKVQGLFASDSVTKMTLFKTIAGEFILLGEEGCSPSKVSVSGDFFCGDLKLNLTRETQESDGLRGVIKEPAWGSTARWSLQESARYE